MGIKFSIYSFRKYGQSKLSKPKELKGINSIFSLDYIRNKCKCQVFIKDNDVWVKHRDYFSPSAVLDKEDLGMPLSYITKKYLYKEKASKFIYGDAWGSIVLRQEAWIKIEGLVNEIKSGRFILDIKDDIRSQQEQCHNMDELELCCTAMERFWENVVMGLRKELVK